ncbi:MAG: hypothetical protein VKP57_11945, partial [Candidatus Sericytochromatia bacterium]|nr:hypothetical protein [Candidatus Sericytochromatia bacterium]
MARIHGHLVGTLLAHDADILGFAGDALLAWFPGLAGRDRPVRRARQAAAVLLEGFAGVLPDANASIGLKIALFQSDFVATQVTVDASDVVTWISGPVWQSLLPITHDMLAGVSVDRLPADSEQAEVPVVRPLAAEASPGGLPHGRIRVLTVVFVRIPGNTGDECPTAWLRATVASLGTYGGALSKVSQDEKGGVLIACFGLHADGSGDAAHGALCWLAALSPYEGQPVAAGVATGRVFLGPVGTSRRFEDAVLGHPVNRAARLSMHGEGGIWCDEATFAVVGERHEVLTRDLLDLKGLGLVAAYRTRPWSGQYLPQAEVFVGRARERDLLEVSLRDLATKGRGAAYVLAGPAGQGKSALLAHTVAQAEQMGLPILVLRGK